MSRERLTPIYEDAPADAPAPGPRRAKVPARRFRFRIAKMDLPVLIVLFGGLCSYRLFGDNLVNAGLDLKAWTRERLHFGDALAQAMHLTIVLVGIEIALRLGKAERKAIR